MLAMNKGLLLAAAWRLAENPKDNIYKILKAKYFPDSSIWREPPNTPKSAFWDFILKVIPLLKSHSFYQITQGNISIWSSPWFSVLERIYDHLIIQNSDFVYPAKVSDLWNSGHKSWNVQLISNLFREPVATAIISTPIAFDSCRDILCWDLTPSGKCNSKSTYKLCLQEIYEMQRNQPRQVATVIKNILQQVWRQKCWET